MNEEYKQVDFGELTSTLEVGKCYNLKESGKYIENSPYLNKPIYLGKYLETTNLKTGNASRYFAKPFVHYFEKRFVSIDPKNLYAETPCKATGGRRASKTRSKRK